MRFFQGYSEDSAFTLDLVLVVIALVPPAFIWLWARSAIRDRELLTEIDVLNARLVSLRKHVDELEDSLSPQSESEGLMEKDQPDRRSAGKDGHDFVCFHVVPIRGRGTTRSAWGAAAKSGTTKPFAA